MPFVQTFSSGGSGNTSPNAPSYEPAEDCNPPAKCFVGGNRIPIVNDGVMIDIRKQGPTDITRYSEVHFPATWEDGNDYLDTIQVTQEDGIFTHPVDIELQVGETDEYVVAHRGLLSGYGSGSHTQNDMVLNAISPSNLLGEISASVSFGANASIRNVVEYVADRLSDNNPVFTDIDVIVPDLSQTTTNIFGQDVSIETLGELQFVEGDGFEMDDSLAISSKTFKANRDYLSDVLNWLAEEIGLRFTFVPDADNGVNLLAFKHLRRDFNTNSLGEEHQLEDAIASLDLIKNQALYEIKPVTTLTLKGKTGVDIGVGPIEVNLWSNSIEPKFPVATVEWVPGRKRAGGRILRKGTAEVTELGRLVEVTTQRLKNMLDQGGSGTMTSLLDPRVEPFSRVRARPVCGDIAERVVPLDYEVEEATHTVPARDELPKTSMRVSPYVSDEDFRTLQLEEEGLPTGWRDA